MYKSLAILGLACCLCSAVSAGTLKAAAAEAIREDSDSKFEARGGPPPSHGGHGGGHGGHGGGGGSEEIGGWGPPIGGGGGGLLGVGGGWGGPGGSSPLHGASSYEGPSIIALSLPIAVILIVALWVAAYNTLRSAPPKIGYNAGLVESEGWGGQQASQAYVQGGYGYADAADPHSGVASNLAASTIVQAAAAHGAAGGVAAGRALDNLTHRVTRSLEKKY